MLRQLPVAVQVKEQQKAKLSNHKISCDDLAGGTCGRGLEWMTEGTKLTCCKDDSEPCGQGQQFLFACICSMQFIYYYY